MLAPVLLLLSLASPPSQPAAAAPIATYDDQMRDLPGKLRKYGLSDAGIRIVVDAIRSEQADIAAATERMSGPSHALQAAAETPDFDPRQFEASFQSYMAAQAELRTIATEHALAMFHALSPPDQKIAARLMTGASGVMIGMPIRPLPKAAH